MKTCNGGYCNYKIFGNYNPECNYDGYCDYQCPKDSRSLLNSISGNDGCCCAGPVDDRGNCMICLLPKRSRL